MKTSTKGFSEEKRVELRSTLCMECEKSWGINGYKKTNIAELTSKASISTGAFYLLYGTKEDLFVDTLKRVQDRLKTNWRNILYAVPSKEGFIKAMKFLFKEYKNSPFLYDFSNPDFIAFISKLPPDLIAELETDNWKFFEEALDIANLKLKVSEKKAFEIINTLLSIIIIRDRVTEDFESIFEFILNATIDNVIK
ncbi:TetR/AcrR family transcriptional regulator [Enterococcus sp. BWB1-3]|uniref:TetR/AcrR family transcriptional regulator n=1 Tax=unclassified Enterococcus TaxID=2608891 RepID=UPI001923B907|nr:MULTISPECIES: TetR/AcrR family transcriptional regulator [unclassified Enterococcus]MBL1229285.1 TetR/AcrR family transcriptional regulator [Enterococcus sp. BWB1-3]MCB5951775.1 TetR/AcrR family transcriptional regulator [Enterococcus sp. BWT-B8]MCB5953942.1 TetR/AcrR family transcriptional regulator [Enterococcus sp. CWB-B31]